ncbi:mitochondrial splicing system protein [Coemansia sp. RSA 1721]|nr:mitochondrial splicing system protein [Coemansia sp. RSA 1721]
MHSLKRLFFPAGTHVSVGSIRRQPPFPQRKPSLAAGFSTPSDTIFALSTHPGKSAIAIVRVSGAQAASVLSQMLPAKRPPAARKATMTRITHPLDTSNTLDTAICLWFPKPNSYTGEDMAEFHIHGGTAVVGSVLQALGDIAGVRMAEAGEFSRRAFDNNKMDLTKLEGVADLINAETEEQRKLAVRQMDGELYAKYSRWRDAIVGARARIEAVIDFSEEENIEDGVYAQVRRDVDVLRLEVAGHLDDRRRGEIMRSGVALSIVGPPNSGKSTMLNKLAMRQVAIVSPIAGTTRDIVETTLDIGGYPVVVRDSAGLRKGSDDVIEIEGIRRAVQSAEDADVRIFMLDAAQALESTSLEKMLDDADWQRLLQLPHTFVVLNKSDTLNSAMTRQAVDQWVASQKELNVPVVLVSCATMNGWDALMEQVAEDIRKTWGRSAGSSMPLTKARHREHLKRCLHHLDTFDRIGDEDLVVLAAEELRAASDALGKITGNVGIEDILDALFSEFCIGK